MKRNSLSSARNGIAALSLVIAVPNGASAQVGPPTPTAEVQQLRDEALKLPFIARVNGLEKALKRAVSSRDKAGEALLAYDCALYLERYGQNIRAMAFASRALGLTRQLKDRRLEALTEDVLATINSDLGNNDQALALLKLAQQTQKEIADHSGEAVSLDEQGAVWTMTGETKKATGVLEQALAIRRAEHERRGEAETLDHLGSALFANGKTDEAFKNFNLAVPIWKEVKDLVGLCTTLDNLGNDSASSDPSGAMDSLNQALTIQKSEKDAKGEAVSENGIGQADYAIGKQDDALAHFQVALKIRQTLRDDIGLVEVRSNLAAVYRAKGKDVEALASLVQVLPVFRRTKNRSGEATILNNIGTVCQELGRDSEAVESFEKALKIQRSIDDKRGEGNTLNGLGSVYDLSGQKLKAITYYQLALPLREGVKDLDGVAVTSGNLGAAYGDLGQFGKAFEYENKALGVLHTIKSLNDEATTYGNIGLLYFEIGQIGSALDHYDKALALFKDQKDRGGQATMLSNIGLVQYRRGNLDLALSTFREALMLAQQVHRRNLETTIINNIALVHHAQHLLDEALMEFETVLTRERNSKDRNGEAIALRNVGKVYRDLGNWSKALDALEGALTISIETGDRLGQADVLNALGLLFAQQNRPREAIFGLKLSINVYQSLRANARTLPKEDQEAFKEVAAGTYRRLADQLISQGRLSEAQSVLNLLKDAEYFNFLRSIPTGKLYFTKSEQNLLRAYDSYAENLAEDATEFDRMSALSSLTDTDFQHMQEISKRLGKAKLQFSEFIKRVEVDFDQRKQEKARIAKLEVTDDLSLVLKRMPVKTAAVYTLATDDGVRTILCLPSASELTPGPRKSVNEADLLRKVSSLRIALTDPHYDPLPLLKEFYDILIRPLEPELSAAHVQHLMFSLDGPLRYIPLAALYDDASGKYLFEKYSCSLFDAGDLVSMNSSPKGSHSGAGFGASAAVPVGDATIPALPSVPIELKAFHEAFNAPVYEDKAFTWSAMTRELFKRPTMLHIASHFELNPGDASNSYLYLGSGDRISMDRMNRELPQGAMTDVDLVVLSACETATPAGDEFEGGEYESFAVVTKRFGAGSVLATLWSVNDLTTAALMSKFYEYLKANPMEGKLEALRAAQLWLLNSSGSLSDLLRSAPARKEAEGNEHFHLPEYKIDSRRPYAHPFYWAPFVLIGNSN